MKIVLISTYELGRQPFGLASPMAWLGRAGHDVTPVDLAIQSLPEAVVADSELAAFYLPMHTATRLAGPVIQAVRRMNPAAHVCAYGLYAPLSADFLRAAGVQTILGGEFESGLTALANRLQGERMLSVSHEISLDRLQFVPPDRSALPPLHAYPKLIMAEGSRIAGYTEASRGCLHRCRHCPVVQVYNGQFRVVQADVVLEDVRRQVAAGAEHISFGDPDFLNGPTHARRIVEQIHREFPALTYDATIKIEHLLQHRHLLPVLRATGCLFVITAVESLEDAVLEQLEKGHTRADFLRVVQLCAEHSLTIAPTFIAFTPWTTRNGYADLLRTLLQLGMIENVPPVQLTLRLLIPSGSRLLELSDIQKVVTGFDAEALVWRWGHDDPTMDRLAADVVHAVQEGIRVGASRREIFRSLWELAQSESLPETFDLMPRTVIPYMEEPWFC